MNKPEHALPFVQPGRLARVCVDDPGRLAAEATRAGEDGGAAALAAAEIKSEWGVICALDRKPGSENHVVEVLCVSEEARRGQFRILPVDADDGPNAIARGREPRVMTVPLTQIDSLSAVRVYQPKNLAQLEGRKRVRNSVVEVLRRFPGGVPALDPEKDMKIDTPAFKKLARRVEALDKMLSQHPMANDPELPGLLELHARRRDLSLQRKMAQRRVRDASGMIMREELSQRMRVLRRLGYISDDGVVKEKGKVACEMQTAHELVATELIFNGTVSEMDDANLVALTSALVWREGSGPTKDIKLTPNVKDALTKLQDAARVCARHESECKMHVDVKEFEESFRPELMEMSRRWADGGKSSGDHADAREEDVRGERRARRATRAGVHSTPRQRRVRGGGQDSRGETTRRRGEDHARHHLLPVVVPPGVGVRFVAPRGCFITGRAWISLRPQRSRRARVRVRFLKCNLATAFQLRR